MTRISKIVILYENNNKYTRGHFYQVLYNLYYILRQNLCQEPNV